MHLVKFSALSTIKCTNVQHGGSSVDSYITCTYVQEYGMFISKPNLTGLVAKDNQLSLSDGKFKTIITQPPCHVTLLKHTSVNNRCVYFQRCYHRHNTILGPFNYFIKKCRQLNYVTVAFNGITSMPSFVKIDPVVQHGYKCQQTRTVALEINSAPDMSSMGFVCARTGRAGFRQADSMAI
jgi:hypothetical protein